MLRRHSVARIGVQPVSKVVVAREKPFGVQSLDDQRPSVLVANVDGEERSAPAQLRRHSVHDNRLPKSSLGKVAAKEKEKTIRATRS